MSELILLRHGQSLWNEQNRFTGWTDVDLTEKGHREAKEAARLLAEADILPDIAHTSLLIRAIRTLWIVLDKLDRAWIPVHRSWRLNERHYGALQGLNKKEMAEQHGDDQVHRWRRSFNEPPPELAQDDERHPRFDPRYAGLRPAELPAAECLADTVARTLPYYQQAIVPQLQAGKTVLICAHGNSLRALIKHLDGLSDEEIVSTNVPTGAPLVYTLDHDLGVTRRSYLGDAEEIARRQAAVAAQGASS